MIILFVKVAIFVFLYIVSHVYLVYCRSLRTLWNSTENVIPPLVLTFIHWTGPEYLPCARHSSSFWGLAVNKIKCCPHGAYLGRAVLLSHIDRGVRKGLPDEVTLEQTSEGREVLGIWRWEVTAGIENSYSRQVFDKLGPRKAAGVAAAVSTREVAEHPRSQSASVFPKPWLLLPEEFWVVQLSQKDQSVFCIQKRARAGERHKWVLGGGLGGCIHSLGQRGWQQPWSVYRRRQMPDVSGRQSRVP